MPQAVSPSRVRGRRRWQRIEKLLKNIPKKLSAADQLNNALELCSNGDIPDYAAFHSWLARKLKAQRHKIPVFDALGARQSFVLSIGNEFVRLPRSCIVRATGTKLLISRTSEIETAHVFQHAKRERDGFCHNVSEIEGTR